MVKTIKNIFLPAGLVWMTATHAATPPAKGGALLEYPRGRFQENVAPDFFKWSMRQKVKSITLKLYKSNLQAKYNPESDLITRYDFTPNVQSMNLIDDTLPIGNYVWVVEGYDDTSPSAIYADHAYFRIEPMRQFEAKTNRIGLIAGFSRGNYNSTDPDYKLGFRTTPTTYGILYGGGDDHHLWEANAYMSDFILRGAVHKTTTIYGGYFWLLNAGNPNAMQFYGGPTFRFLQYPEVRSTNGTDITSSTVSAVLPGLSFKMERQLDQHIMLHTHLGYDTAVYGSKSIKLNLEKGSYNAHVGIFYSLFWPIGFNGEFQYRLDQATTKENSEEVFLQTDQWSVVANLIYAL